MVIKFADQIAGREILDQLPATIPQTHRHTDTSDKCEA